MIRRLPVYLLLDVSTHVAGPLQVALREAIAQWHAIVGADPVAAERLYMGWITLENVPLKQRLVATEYLTIPPVMAQGVAAWDRALAMLAEALTFEVVAPRPGRPGDARPVVIMVIAADLPTKWQAAVQHVRQQHPFDPIVLALNSTAATGLGAFDGPCFQMQPDMVASVVGFFVGLANQMVERANGVAEMHWFTTTPLPHGVQRCA